MNNCIPAKWGVYVEPGDSIKFEMPGFCSGEYTYIVEQKNGISVLEDKAPKRIFDGCYDYEIIKKGNKIE